MKQARYCIWFLGFLSLIVIADGCSNIELPPPESCETNTPTYNNEVKEIIAQTCAYSGCHDGAGGLGPGDYMSYAGILSRLQSGLFASRVIDNASSPTTGMPPDASVYPESIQDDLTTEQFETIRCWLQNGFPE